MKQHTKIGLICFIIITLIVGTIVAVALYNRSPSVCPLCHKEGLHQTHLGENSTYVCFTDGIVYKSFINENGTLCKGYIFIDDPKQEGHIIKYG